MKIILTFLFCILLPVSALAGIHEDIWNKYAASSDSKAGSSNSQNSTSAPLAQTAPDSQEPSGHVDTVLPGKLLGKSTKERQEAFSTIWKYRKKTYELHFEDPTALARTAYGLALFSGDVDENLPQEKFVAGVLGYHYSMEQVCNWATTILGQRKRTILDENMLLGSLLADDIIRFDDGKVVSTGKVSHILAAAPGKKRSYAINLLHERLHVFWDEDAQFRNGSIEKWKGLPAEDITRIRKELHQYAQGNEAQLIEEWAITNAEKNGLSIN